MEKKRVVPAAIMLLIAFVVLVGCGSSSPADVVNNLEKKIMSKVPGEKGKVLATVEDTKVYKKMFDLYLDAYISQSGLPAAEQMKRKNSPRILNELLSAIIVNKIIMKELKSDKKIMNDPQFLIVLNFQLAEVIKQTYAMWKARALVSTDVSDKDIANAYNKAKKNPRLMRRFARAPYDKVKAYLRRYIVASRQRLIMRQLMSKLKAKYRIDIKDSAFGGRTVPKLNLDGKKMDKKSSK